jgi:hypothetical protein|eukprot:COSAG06_NODE_495_length_15047_cov_11.349478_2_plen_76_part_00
MDMINYHNVLEIQTIKSMLVGKPLLLRALNSLIDLVNEKKLTKENLVEAESWSESETDSDYDFEILVSSSSDEDA